MYIKPIFASTVVGVVGRWSNVFAVSGQWVLWRFGAFQTEIKGFLGATVTDDSER